MYIIKNELLFLMNKQKGRMKRNEITNKMEELANVLCQMTDINNNNKYSRV